MVLFKLGLKKVEIDKISRNYLKLALKQEKLTKFHGTIEIWLKNNSNYNCMVLF